MNYQAYQRALIQIDTGRRTIARPRRWGRWVVAIAMIASVGFWLAR